MKKKIVYQQDIFGEEHPYTVDENGVMRAKDKNETPILFADKIKAYAVLTCSNCYNTCRISFTDVAKANARVFKVCCPWCEYENTVDLKYFNDKAKFIFEKV